MLRTAISALGSEEGWAPAYDAAPRICAGRRSGSPLSRRSFWRPSTGFARVATTPSPRGPNSGCPGDYLWMLNGVEPEPSTRRAVEQYLVLTVDHGFNASTFAARVIASTGADLAAAVTGAIGALSGPLHGGAPSRALDMLDAIHNRGVDQINNGKDY